MFYLKVIFEKSGEYNIQTHHNFLFILEKYDIIISDVFNKDKLERSIPPKLERLIGTTMRNV